MLNEIAFVCFIFSFFLSLGFLFIHLKYASNSRRNLWYQLMNSWVDKHLEEKKISLAVQGIRNLIMANSGLISAQLILLGIIIGFRQDFLNDTTPFRLIMITNVGTLQFFTFVSLLLLGAFSFILSSRTATTISFLIAGQVETETNTISGNELIKRTFLSMQNAWLVGIRTLFFLIASLFWLIHPVLFITISIFISLYLIMFRDFAVFKR